MGYHLDGPLGRFTEVCASRREAAHSTTAQSPLLDVVLVGLTALGTRIKHESDDAATRRPRTRR